MSGSPTALDQHDAVWAALEAIENLATYDGEVPANPPTDEEGRSAAYAVLYFSPGDQHATGLDARQGANRGSFQVTCAGGDPTRALWAVDQVRAALLGAITISGRRYWVRHPEGADPAPLRRDDKKSPPRHYVPLEFQLYVP